jgi:hypothetical protein
VTCGDATLRHGIALEPSVTGGCTTGSVTAARVAAPTLLDVIPSFRRHLRGRTRLPGRLQTEVRYRAGALAPTIRAVGILDLGVGILDRLRLSAFIPRLDIAVEGSAQLCTDEHFMVVLPTMEGESPRKTDVHIDVSLELWTKGTLRIAVLELRDAAAVRQLLKDRREPFSPLTLEPGTPKVSADFTLEPADGGALQAGEGSRLTFGLRLDRNGRDRRVSLKVGAPR